jgi:hypothetical protein
MAHGHLLGQKWKVFAVTPSGDTVPLIRINEWDFNWQGNFYFNKLIILPANSVVHAYATYDNTTNNPNNPNNPPLTVSWGEGTSDEMYYLPILYVNYQQGDENIVFDGADSTTNPPPFYTVEDKLYPIVPNPASNMIKVGFTLATDNYISIKIHDMNGKELMNPINKTYFLAGLHSKEINVSALPAGMYVVVMQLKNSKLSQKLIILD